MAHKTIIAARIEAAQRKEDAYIIKQKTGFITVPVRKYPKGVKPANIADIYRHVANKDVLRDIKDEKPKTIKRKRKSRKS